MTSSSFSEPLGKRKAGFSGIIDGFIETSDDSVIAQIDQLREMGFAEGLSVQILHQNPFGKDPIAVQVGSMTVALRRREANLVQVSAP